ncbi:MAG TPA: DUF2442 domain-containing protein [Chitinophagaceae bacterium]|nr:DUF2442 domain-containing protein [Chitinophagaceae bacterium]
MTTTINNKIESINFTKDTLLIKIGNKIHELDLNVISKPLLNATAEERLNYQISPANYGIHWPLLDEDISVYNLINTSK